MCFACKAKRNVFCQDNCLIKKDENLRVARLNLGVALFGD